MGARAGLHVLKVVVAVAARPTARPWSYRSVAGCRRNLHTVAAMATIANLTSAARIVPTTTRGSVDRSREVRHPSMKPSAPVIVSPAGPADAENVWRLQRAAFRAEAELYGDDRIPPLTQTLEELTREFASKVCLKACDAGGRLVGAVRLQRQGATVLLGRLSVEPACQRQGIGSALLRAAERVWPDAERMELFTGSRSIGNLRLYERHGYVQFREATTPTVTLVYLEKTLRPPAGVGV